MSMPSAQKKLDEFICPAKGQRVLDIGCGTARILDILPDVEYHGFDMSQDYIDAAISRHGTRGHFSCLPMAEIRTDDMEPFDIVMALGVLHHMDDNQVIELIELAHSALRADGRLVTIDPCYADDQNLFSRFLVSHDRGRNVRTAGQYRALAGTVFSRVTGEVVHNRWIPHTHWIMKCQL